MLHLVQLLHLFEVFYGLCQKKLEEIIRDSQVMNDV